MTTRYLPALTFALTLGLPLAGMAAPTLDCQLGAPDSKAALAQAPHGVERPTPHSLHVNWSQGRRIFNDQPPFDVPLEGVQWHYCGYDPANGVHLIQKVAGELVSGVLLDNRTGRLIEAGQQVLLSPDGQLVFARRQPDSVDGEQWLLIRRKGGRPLWQGLSYLTWPASDRRMADLTEPHWDQGELTARVSCAAQALNPDAERPEVRLKKTGRTYAWQPTITCPDTPAAP